MKNFILVFLVFMCISCFHNNNKKTIIISNIEKAQLDSLKVNFNVSSFYVKIKGYVNDTCYVNKNKLSGQIDTIIKGDWYYDIYYLKYEPNKAKRGELKIEYGLY